MLKLNNNKVLGLNFFLLNKLFKNSIDCLRNLSPLKKGMNRRGSIGITIVMLVFCLLMSVSMSYHKTIQTESMIQNNINYSDRAVDAAFSGINYAMAVIQSNKKVFSPTKNYVVAFTPDSDSSNESGTNIESKWISLASTATFTSYLDDDRGSSQQKQHPPYRFKIACRPTNYNFTGTVKVILKSYGEYIKYDENDNIVASFSAQLMAECIVDKTTKTLRLNRYRKMQVQDTEDELFYTFGSYEND